MSADEIDDLTAPPAAPVAARRAGLRVELTTVPPIGDNPRPPRISWHSLSILFLPYLTVAACIVAAVLLTRGARP